VRVLVLGYPLALTLAAKSLFQRPEITDQIEKFLLAQRGSASNETEISHGRVLWRLVRSQGRFSRPHSLLFFLLLNTLNGRFSTRIDGNRNGSVAFMSFVVVSGPFVMCD